jgi:hypothetical protein
MENQGFPTICIEKDTMKYLKKIKRSLISYNKSRRDLDASYRQSLKNKKEREDNEEYLKELKDKL